MRTRHPFGASNAFYLAAIVVLVVVAAVFAGLYFNATHESNDNAARIVGVVVGTDKPLPKTLDPSFKDANGDLIADAPTDPSKFINPDPLVFSFVADNPEAYKAIWQEFTDHLAKVTGKKVVYSMVASANEQLRDFAEGRLHVTGFNTGSVPIAVDLAGFVPVFTLGTQQAGGFLHMEIIVPADSPIQTIDDLRGHTITLVDVNSNSGCKAALVILKTKFNLLPEKDYTIRYSLGQEKSVEGIADKTYEVAAVASDVLTRAVANGKIGASQYRTIYSSEDFPAVAFGYAYNLDPALAAKVREAFTTFDFKGTLLQQRFAPSKQDSFQPLNYKNDFALVRFIDDQIGKPYHLPNPVDQMPPATESTTQK